MDDRVVTDERPSVDVVQIRGWDVVRLSTDLLEVDVLPGKGGDILGVRWRTDGTDVLWRTPWGLRHKGAVPTAADSQTAFLENYPGGWQTLFPNGGTETSEQGARLGFHGEATLAPWDWEQVPTDEGVAVDVTTCLVRSPFRLHRRIAVVAGCVTVTEHFTNEAKTAQDAMWSHHPAFGTPFLDGNCTIETGAGTFLADRVYDTPNGDLAPGVRTPWPHAQTKDGSEIDLGQVPSANDGLDRFGYLLDFAEPWYAITNPRLALTATVRWDLEIFPYAWFWCEAEGTLGFPWYQRAYVLAVEPAASYPGAGLAAARESGTVVRFAPGQTRTAVVSLEVGRSA
ncbi:MAG: aldose 1-epimerase [Mycobacteriales bacterium]